MTRPAVWVVGEALVDLMPSGPVPGGAPFNVARTLAQLCQPVQLISRIGQHDPGANLVREAARRFTVPLHYMQADGVHPTGLVQVHVQGAAHQFSINTGAAWEFIEAEPALQALDAQPAPLLYFGTLAQRGTVSRSSIRRLAAHSQCRFLDLNLRDGHDNRLLAQDSLALADWVKVNDDELRQLYAWFLEPPAPDATDALSTQHIAALMQRFNLHRLLVTCGAKGYACFNAQGHCLAQGSGVPLDTVVDTVGAGDAFAAMFIAAYNRGIGLSQALHLANAYAAWICTVVGPLPSMPGPLQTWKERLMLSTQTPGSPTWH